MAEYVDREDILRRWNKALQRMVPEDDGKHAISFETIIQFIKEYPAADVVEVVHSRWKNFRKQGIAVCMNCSFERNLDDNFGRAISCPNCGARMDGDT